MLYYGWDWRLDGYNMMLIQRQTINVEARRWINVRWSMLIQRQLINVDSTSSFQRPSNFQIQTYFYVVSTLRSDVDSTLKCPLGFNSTRSYHSVSSAFYGNKWTHQMNGLIDPTDNTFVRNILESAKRTAKKPCKKKDSITSDLIIELCYSFSHSEDLCTVKSFSMITTVFFGFFEKWWTEDNHLKLFIPKSKTFQYRNGCEILLSQGQTSACPVKMFKRYISTAKLDVRSTSVLFKAVNKSHSVSKLISKDKKLSYTRTKECIISLFKSVNHTLDIGLHSWDQVGCLLLRIIVSVKGV